jgi:hypothetical protein
MTLRDLISNCTFKKTFNELYKNYFKGSLKNDEIQKLDLRYYKFFEYLKSLPENKTSSNKIYVTHTSGDDFVVDVCFLDKNKDELFALDFINWDDIIDLEVYRTFKITDEECLAHILHEITFWGFDKETLDKQKKILRNSIDESDR